MNFSFTKLILEQKTFFQSRNTNIWEQENADTFTVEVEKRGFAVTKSGSRGKQTFDLFILILLILARSAEEYFPSVGVIILNSKASDFPNFSTVG